VSLNQLAQLIEGIVYIGKLVDLTIKTLKRGANPVMSLKSK
jgi:hypothetical protein